jgi:hypothetical protein
MSRAKLLSVCIALAGLSVSVTQAAEIILLDAPIKVTATLNARAEGGYTAQIGVHNGPIAQLVNTAVTANTQPDAELVLRKQVQWHTPYLFVHSSCSYNRSLRCEGETVFKLADASVLRLGDLIGTAPAVYNRGHFLDVYDKLEGQLHLAPGLTPSFVIVLDDVGRQFAVNAAVTWSSNADAWQQRARQLAAAHPDMDWPEPELAQYLSALVSNAALARYCNRQDELQKLLNAAQSVLAFGQLRMVTDALSKVVPMELPKAWRKPY